MDRHVGVSHGSVVNWLKTYLEEGENVGLRHYLTWIVGNGRCGSHCLVWLNRQLTVFAHAWTQRKSNNRLLSTDKKPMSDFICIPGMSLQVQEIEV